MQFEFSTWAVTASEAMSIGPTTRDPRRGQLPPSIGIPHQPTAGALLSYNPSPKYVAAVIRYAREMQTDPTAFYSYYAWQVFARTTSGVRQLTGPGHA